MSTGTESRANTNVGHQSHDNVHNTVHDIDDVQNQSRTNTNVDHQSHDIFHDIVHDIDDVVHSIASDIDEHVKHSFLERLSLQRLNCFTVIGDDGNRSFSLRSTALSLSLVANIAIFATKVYAYISTSSLSVLAALVDSTLDLLSQMILFYVERKSSKVDRSSDAYPAGASQLEPIGVLVCATLMAMASFSVLTDSAMDLVYMKNKLTPDMNSLYGMIGIVLTKFLLFVLCKKASHTQSIEGTDASMSDATLEALACDHLNDVLSNAVAAAALITAIYYPHLWYLDPIGAIVISAYIMYSWWNTGKDQILQLSAGSAPASFVEKVRNIITDFDDRIVGIDACRAYYFGPKFFVEIEIVLPENTPLRESHNLGIDLQYEIEGKEEVERCFVHCDFESRAYDEHVVSKTMSDSSSSQSGSEGDSSV